MLLVLGGQRPAAAQPTTPTAPLTLPECVRYALQNQPIVRQAKLDEEVNEAERNVRQWLDQGRPIPADLLAE
jgi:hypothetical protein